MSAIFGLFTEFLHAHMTIYWNLTQNITKGQTKCQKKGSKRVKRGKNIRYFEKLISYRNYGTYECNIWHVYKMFAGAYGNLSEFDPKYNQGSKLGQKWSKKVQKPKKGSKRVQNRSKMVKILKSS